MLFAVIDLVGLVFCAFMVVLAVQLSLFVAKHGTHNPGGITMDPDAVEEVLTATARDHPCPEPRLHSYADKARGPAFNALCEGDAEFNGFYGHGIVDALAAVH